MRFQFLNTYPKPSCLQTTLASLLSQESSQTVPRLTPATSTLPWYGVEPSFRLTAIRPCGACKHKEIFKCTNYLLCVLINAKGITVFRNMHDSCPSYVYM